MTGSTAHSQNRWPSLAFDVGAVNDIASPMFSAGFYYKTFMWPKAAWKSLYEPKIRAAAGLGVAPDQPDPDHYSSRFAHCEVLVLGGGAAGIAAALAAAETGVRVILCRRAGGVRRRAALRERREDRRPGRLCLGAGGGREARRRWTMSALLPRTTAFGYYAQNFVGLVERVTDHLANPGHDLPRERLWQVRAKRVVLATGAIERHMVFADNDRPGVMLASAARTYLNHYGVAVGRNVGVYTANDSAYAAAIDLKKAGVERRGHRRSARQSDRAAGRRGAGARHRDQSRPRRGQRAGGKLRVSSMTMQPKNGGGERTIPVDALLMSAGWTPSVHLFSQSRGKVAFDDATKRFLPGTYAQDCVSVGACNGTDGLSATVDEAYAAGAKAAKDAGAKGRQGGTKPKVDAGESWAGGMLGAAPGAGAGHDGQGLRRFPERRHRQGHPPGGA